MLRQLAVLAVLLGACMAQDPVQVPGYLCPPDKCTGANGCHCASWGVPGGLSASDIPQFVVLTNDDAITVQSMPVILGVTNKFSNKKNGCKIPATWFVSINYTDPSLVQEVYMNNHEIASHTYHHVMNPDVNEIVSAKLWLNMTAHVPLEKIRGFRAPYLVHNAEQRQILHQNGFLYDSSIPEPYGMTATSPEPSKRLWPYSMDFGLPQRCDLGTGSCSVNESQPGLWEFPMWDIQDDNGVVLTNMDPQGDLYEIYKREFDRNYNGNRAPLGIYIHAAWLMADDTRVPNLERFIQYALGKDNVIFATITEVIEWIKNPVPYSAYNYNVGCKAPTDMWFPSGSFCPKKVCQHGNWSDVDCSCHCAGENLQLQPGFCTDADGACTVAKVFDEPTKTFYCPGKPNAGSSSSGSGSSSGGKQATPVDNPGAFSSDPSCGHALANFVGLGMSGTSDNAALYTEAMKAVDGRCNSCARATSSTGNFFMLSLGTPTPLKQVYVVTANDLSGAFIFAGNSSSNSGMSNPPCAKNLDIGAARPTLVDCDVTAAYVTIATPGSLSLCDIYPMTPDSAPIDTSSLVLPKKDGTSSRKLRSLVQ